MSCSAEITPAGGLMQGISLLMRRKDNGHPVYKNLFPVALDDLAPCAKEVLSVPSITLFVNDDSL